ncbi:MAG TPA: M6 family metalloprotease domain-containing protein, partial [Candidatus Bathyarchaeia archaeon]|nr:M6 family metalloprotease domain-containing protein [Candidatus Bathyarchaeia archaeon]
MVGVQIFGWYTVPHTMAYYGHDTKKPGDDVNIVQLAEDAVTLLPTSVDYTVFKYLMIVHAGKDQALNQWNQLSDEIWSETYSAMFPDYYSTQAISAGSKNFQSYSFLSEFDGVGTFAHEVTHLFGLPDLFDTNNQDSYLGFWSLLDSGEWCCADTSDTTPSHIGGWAAAMLGWLTPTVVDTTLPLSSFTFQPLESEHLTVILIPVSFYTYYLLEYRTQTGVDSSLPASGMLIYYVDESLDPTAGILKLVNPATGSPFKEQSAPSALNTANFNPGDKFEDLPHQVFLEFLTATSSVTALYSSQQITGSLLGTNLISPSSSVTTAYGSPTSFVAILRDQNGKPLFNQTVLAEIQNPTTSVWNILGSATTDENGAASIPANVTTGSGTYPFRILYPGSHIGSDWYESSSSNLVLNVTPATMIITISTTPVILTNTFTISLTASGLNNQPLIGALLTINLDGEQKTVITNSQGTATLALQLSSNALGSHSISVTGTTADYAGNTTASVTYFPWVLIIVLGAIIGSFALLLHNRRHQEEKPELPKSQS